MNEKNINMKFNSLTDAVIEELKKIVGKGNVITEGEKLETYSHDETNAHVYGHAALRLVYYYP